MLNKFPGGPPGVSVGWGSLEVSRVSLSTKRSGLLLVAQLKEHHPSETAHSNIKAPGWPNFNSSGTSLVLRRFPLVTGLQEAKQQETPMPCVEGTQHSAVGHFSAFIPDSGCQQPFFSVCSCTGLCPVQEQIWPDDLSTHGKPMSLQWCGGREVGW